MKLSIATPLMESEDQYRYLAWASEAGFDAVECEIAHPADPEVNRVLSEGLKRYGLGFSGIRSGVSYTLEGLCMSSPDPGVRAAAVARLMECNRMVAAFPGSLTLIGMMQGVLDSPGRYPEARGFIVESMKAVCRSAQELGVRVSLEPVNHMIVNYHNTVAEVAEIIDAVDSPALGMLIDTFHMNIEEKNMIAAVELVGDMINHVHVADSNRRAPGEGNIDFPAFFEALGIIGYDGWVTVEALEKPDFPTLARRSMAYLRDVLP